jgi:hypothetical protein
MAFMSAPDLARQAPVAAQPQPQPQPPVNAVSHGDAASAHERRADPLAATLARTVLQRSLLDDLLGAVSAVVDAARNGPAITTVRLFIKAGSTDENYLTNIAFWFVHPEIEGTKLRPKEVPEHKALVEEWLALRDQLVRPELKRAKADSEPPAEEPSGPAPAPAPAGKLDSTQFLAANRGLLAQLDASDDELLMLLDDTLRERSAVRLEYTSYSKATKPVPLTQKLFMRRNPAVDVVAKLGPTPLKDWQKKADAAGGWAGLGVTSAQWVEIAGIRDDIVYPFLRIVLPRIESAGTLRADASAGERIAHRAHAYLGVRYAMGGRYAAGGDPLKADPSKEAASRLDCASLVRKVLGDLQLTVKNGPNSDGDGGATSPLRNSPDVDTVDVGSLQPGDLLFRPRLEAGKVVGEHVGILVDQDWLIEAPHTGRVVSKTPFLADKWTWFRRRKAK